MPRPEDPASFSIQEPVGPETSLVVHWKGLPIYLVSPADCPLRTSAHVDTGEGDEIVFWLGDRMLHRLWFLRSSRRDEIMLLGEKPDTIKLPTGDEVYFDDAHSGAIFVERSAIKSISIHVCWPRLPSPYVTFETERPAPQVVVPILVVEPEYTAQACTLTSMNAPPDTDLRRVHDETTLYSVDSGQDNNARPMILIRNAGER